MIGLSGLPAWAEAAALIGVVLVEAMILYVGYGAVEQAIGQKLIDRLTS
ncbi:DUF7512 family protein [Salinarchaeum laminariae]|nr:hypothetical protein [Salinarchaeum laminariae]